MAILSGRLTITDSPALVILQPEDRGGYTLIIQNLSNSKSVFLSGAAVSPEIGFELIKGQSITIPVAPDESLYAITNMGDVVPLTYLVSTR